MANRFSSIFSQILDLFSRREFFEIVRQTQAERGAKYTSDAPVLEPVFSWDRMWLSVRTDANVL